MCQMGVLLQQKIFIFHYFIYLLSSHICVSLYMLLNCNIQLIHRIIYYYIHALLYYPPDTGFRVMVVLLEIIFSIFSGK